MDWNALRDQFPVTRRWAFFDHAAVAPLSAPAAKAMTEWVIDVTENGDVHEKEWSQRVEAVRVLAGRLLDADPSDIAFIKNTSEGIGIVAEGLPWRPGDNVVTAHEEYPANIYPWMNLAARGVQLRRVPSRHARLHIDDLQAAIDRRTRLVSLSMVEFASGFRNDLDAIGAMCRERNVLFLVDAIQGLGVLPLSVRRTPVDFLAADGHKWLLAPEGAGVFFIRRELVEQLHAVDIGWNSVQGARDFSRVDFRLKPHAGRWESGALNVAGITALGASLDLLLGIGLSAVEARVMELTDYLCTRAEAAGWHVFSSRRPGEKSGIVSLLTGEKDPRALVRQCRAQGIAINQRAGRLRVCPHCYNTTSEIERLIEALGPAPAM
jgi:selenocysteine lyase/cysteine desulfurase